MQMMMMKAYILTEEARVKEGGSSSSTDAWVPKNAKEAFEVIQKNLAQEAKSEVAALARELRDSA